MRGQDMEAMQQFLKSFGKESPGALGDVELLASALKTGYCMLARAASVFVQTVWFFALRKLLGTCSIKDKKNFQALVKMQLTQVENGKRQMSRDMFHPLLMQKAEQVKQESQK